MPENSDILENKLELDLGLRANGKRVDNVKLPKWASSANNFLKLHRLALESDYVSNHLHEWIDLIFGCKQNSIDDDNVFHPYSYEGNIDFENIEDPLQRRAYETQIREFGQTPRKLFGELHPKKGSKIQVADQSDSKDEKHKELTDLYY